MTSSPFDPRRWKPAPLLPREEARDGALVFVVAVLCFIACLTVVTALAANRAATGWRSQLVGSATVLVRPKGDETPDAAAARAAETLAGVKGVIQASALEKAKAQALLEPWLGRDSVLDDLPVPRLVALDLDPAAPATAADLDRALKGAGIDATIDDHSLWMKDIERAGRAASLAAVGVAVLIAAAAAAVIAFATRAGLAARRDVIEVLHHSGAEDRFVAQLFQRRFSSLAASAGLFGAAGAVIIAAAVRAFGGADGLTPALPISWWDLLAPLPCPLIAALVATLAARSAAMRMLKGMN